MQLEAGATVDELLEAHLVLPETSIEVVEVPVASFRSTDRSMTVSNNASLPVIVYQREVVEVRWRPTAGRNSQFKAYIKGLYAGVTVNIAYRTTGSWIWFTGATLGLTTKTFNLYAGTNGPTFSAALFNTTGGSSVSLGATGAVVSGSVNYTASGARTVQVTITQQ